MCSDVEQLDAAEIDAIAAFLHGEQLRQLEEAARRVAARRCRPMRPSSRSARAPSSGREVAARLGRAVADARAVGRDGRRGRARRRARRAAGGAPVLTVVKVGGGLGRGAGDDALRALCATLGELGERHPLLVVPGGAWFADAVREADRRFALPATTSHRMAVLGMEQFGWLLSELIPGAVRSAELAPAAGPNDRAPARRARRSTALPASWEVTSDSIAAWVAGRAGAGRLVLVKEVDGLFAEWPARGEPIARMTVAELAALRPAGVDEHLPTVLEAGDLRDVGDQRARPRSPRRAARTRRRRWARESPERACYRGAMDAQQRPSTRGATLADPTLREYKLVGGLETFANRSFWPGFFSRVAARKQWDAAAIDFAPDARAWEELPDERRQRLTTLLAGFRVGEDAVAEQLTPFVAAANRETLASQESLMAWTFTLQRRDEERHARFFDRIAAEVLAAARRDPRRAPRSGPRVRHAGDPRALRGAAAHDGRGARGG